MGMGLGIAGFICFLINSLLGLLVLALLVNAILSWLLAFDIINYRNRFVAQIAQTLEMIVAPVLAPFRAFIPSLGGLDITPVLAWIVISGMQRYLLPPGCAALADLLGGV
ncbi:YggT family protein [Rhizobium sp. CRIBSB]|nr:YggT family protein [Rhizobium sp. CRIBSB]